MIETILKLYGESVIDSKTIADRDTVPIKLRLAILFSFVTAVILIVGSVLFLHQVSYGLKSSLVTELRAKGYILGQNVSGSQQSGQTGTSFSQEVPPNLNSSDTNSSIVQLPGLPFSVAAPNSTITAAQILTKDGIVLESYGVPASTLLIGASQSRSAAIHEVITTKYLYKNPTLFLAVSIPGSGGEVAVIGASLRNIDSRIEGIEVELGLFGILLVLVAGLVAWALSGAALAPVSKMRQQVEEIFTLGQWGSLEIPKTKDEVANLARTLSDLLRRLEESISVQRGFITVAGHELRTPLAILKGELELAQKSNRTETELRHALAEALEDTERIIRLSEHLLLLARTDEGAAIATLETKEISPILARSTDDFANLAKEQCVSFVLDCDKSVICEVDESALRQIMANLLGNSLRHSPFGAAIHITCEYQSDSVVLVVEDQGSGFPIDFIPLAFERFSRANEHRDRASGGSGLGLAIVKSLVEAMNGRVTASNGPSGGAQVTIRFPMPDFIKGN
ncbi:MAG: HAMP domain-containing sensor histidine kinase [Actinomycetota bacterium]|nr:HAMP domain-containing sensor histidine kinase [Actinomycetota bacterium]